MGNNEGDTSTRPLYFAETDARKMSGVLEDLGGVPASNQKVMLGASRFTVFEAIGSLKGKIAEAKKQGDQTVFYLYYSGHADEHQLQLGRTWITWAELGSLLDGTGADVRVAFIDACQSGSMVRQKGGTLAPSFVFDISDRLEASGSVIITSSTSDEASQESNEIGGSYFTHFLVSALSGTADEDGNGRVTLGEAYRQVFHETVLRTAGTRSGTQHPTYEWELTGTGDLVITELARAQASLVLDGMHLGTFAIFDQDRRMFVAELGVAGMDRSVPLRPGRYLVQKRYPTHLAVAEVKLVSGGRVRVGEADFHALEYEDDVAKGAIDAQIRKVDAPVLSISGQSGLQGFGNQIGEQYFPGAFFAGGSLQWTWRNGVFVQTGGRLGLGIGNLDMGLSYEVPTVLSMGSLGGGIGLTTRGVFHMGAGLHLEGISIGRSFPGQGLEAQSLVTVAPGLLATVGLDPGRATLALTGQVHYLPYLLDGRNLGVLYGSLSLEVGMKVRRQ
jgi:hypothetical protein